MKKSHERLKAEFLAEAEGIFDELMEWEGNTAEPDLSQIEAIVLRLRKRLGEGLALAVIERQEKRAPGVRPKCKECGVELENKGMKGNRVESLAGVIGLKRGYYHCKRCQQGFFPLDEQLALWEKHWSEQVAKQAVWLSGDICQECMAAGGEVGQAI